MIKANELRRGNYILPEHDLDGKYHVVNELGEGSINNYIENWYSPIPITPEILERCGFVVSDMGGHYNDIYEFNNVSIADSSKVSPFNYCYEYHKNKEQKKWFRGINYLHELQNLFFALTGQELEIKELAAS